MSGALTLATPRTDDPLAGVSVPKVAAAPADMVQQPSHLQEVYAELVSRLPLPDDPGASYHAMPDLHTGPDYDTYIDTRLAAWKASRQPAAVVG